MTALSLRDESDLSWFFSRGQSAFERSPAGTVLERAKLFSQAHATYEDVNGQTRRHYPQPAWPKLVDGEICYSEWEPTAKPTAEVVSSGGSEPDNDVLIRYGVVSRRLQQLERVSPASCAVLERFFGDTGEGLALSKLGRIVSLYPLTASGAKLLHQDDERSRKAGSSFHMTPDQRMANILASAKTQAVREALARCERQAEQMLTMACEHWVAVVGERRRR